MNNLEKAVTFNELKWDTDYFGVASAKAILHRPLSLNEWDELKTRFKDYQFISIVNQNSEPFNAQLIGKDTSAFLADVNIQFEKRVFGINELPKNVTIHYSLERNEKILEIADFKFSKFTEDAELARRGGDQVYRQWIINSFKRQDKYHAVSNDENGNINGFVLFSYSDNQFVIELIAVSQKKSKGGVGTSLFKAVEYVAHQQGCSEIKVGTQVRNIVAINFYHKVGCKQIESHQVFHLWNN
ncbi:GNAT family N-acetyltransferase [Schinkia azotoformans]|uniref:GCN5-like N-acetyltransferase n=1 Tax=Schinkia azotoformans LMG 9581 TaxID=1131731 RepID=K6D3C1_SCHAZ|nr:GNAT family N-acetyltransferase [Schinkia azotoformans]EKN62764.1 GCN5-like N-acetyltransferase [Schinkia azotoformans LMG 9581]MEC1639140.1 GNAT family N-acetyltransferase [Schinkia azotoformans]MEC1945728.1 GNAT family N-acetyltransferase [Schinkia azotoformans]